MSIQEATLATPTFQREIITPEMASMILAGNTHNRKVREVHVARLVSTLQNGEWQFNGQPIQITKNGMVVDGQHRLIACVRSGIPIDVLVVYNATFESQETIDMGKSRTVSDSLSLRGHKDSTHLAAFISRVLGMKKASLREVLHGNGIKSVTPGQIISFAESNDIYDRYVLQAGAVSKVVAIPATVIAVCMWVTDAIDWDDSQFFWERLKSGNALEDGSPILALRNWALDVSRVRSNGGSANVDAGARIIKSWNKFRSGETVQRVTWRPGGANAEQFPEAI